MAEDREQPIRAKIEIDPTELTQQSPVVKKPAAKKKASKKKASKKKTSKKKAAKKKASKKSTAKTSREAVLEAPMTARFEAQDRVEPVVAPPEPVVETIDPQPVAEVQEPQPIAQSVESEPAPTTIEPQPFTETAELDETLERDPSSVAAVPILTSATEPDAPRPKGGLPMRLILIVLALLAAALYVKILLPPGYLEGKFAPLVTTAPENAPPPSAPAAPEQETTGNLQPVPASQMLVIKKVFAPELIQPVEKQ